MRWDDPEVETVAPGVHRAPVPLPNDGLRAVNVYVIEDGEEIVLVDSGWDGAEARQAVDGGLAVAGAEVGDVRRMLITHMHYDHLGQATELRRAGAGEYWLGEDEKESFRRVLADPTASRARRMAQLARHGATELAERGRHRARFNDPPDWEEPIRWAADGDEEPLGDGEQLVAVATPGHTRGHLCFHHPRRRLLFAGDHVLPHITPSIGFEPHTNPMALADFLQSLAKVASLADEVDMVLPAHGGTFTDLAGRVDELTAHHDERLRLCLAGVATAGSTAHDVAQQVPWTRRHKDYAELDAFNQALAVWETAAHLELLAARGRLTRAETDQQIRFAPPAS